MRRRIAAQIRNQWAGFLALFLVIAGGTAYAAATIGSAEIIDNSVASVDLKDTEVKTSDLAPAAVINSRLAPNAVAGGKILDGSVGRADLQAGLVSYASGAVAFTGIANVCSTPADCGLTYDRNVTRVTNPRTGIYCVRVAGATPSNSLILVLAEYANGGYAEATNTVPAANDLEDCNAGEFRIRTYDLADNHGSITLVDDILFSFTVVP